MLTGSTNTLGVALSAPQEILKTFVLGLLEEK